MNTHTLISHAATELVRAEGMYPNWPTNLVEQAAIVVEEAGELLQCANNIHHKQGHEDLDDLIEELIQLMAMGMRFGKNLPDYDGEPMVAPI